ncbi:MAG: EI24 domain-containing protein [Sphingorhabdus sp.]
MIRALLLSFQSLADRRVAMLLVKVMLLTLLVFGLLGIGLWYALDAAISYLGWRDGGALSALASVALLLLSGVLLFRVIAVAITWIFADDIIDAVEDRHYPAHAELGTRPGLAQAVGMALRSAARVIGYNLLALPVYVVLLVTGVGTAIAFLLVNALLLGRDLEDMLIARHGEAHGSIAKLPRLLLGLMATAAMLVPFVNLVVPVIATAMAVHMVHSNAKALG